MNLALLDTDEGDRIRRQTCALILAAGRSSRMGRFKPLLPLGDICVVERVIHLFKAAGVAAIYVVVGHRGEDLRSQLAGSDVTLVSNPSYAEGMFSSIKAGLEAVGTGFDNIFIQPVDVPLVRPATVHLSLAALAGHAGKVIHPTWKGQRGHPPLIPASLIPAIQNHDGEGGLRALLEAPGVYSVEIPVPDRYILMDMDDPERYEALRGQLAGYEIPNETECEILLRSTFRVNNPLLRHSRTVAAVATDIAARLRHTGHGLDLKLVGAGALLHDIAKGEKDHARRGAQYLQRLGFDRVAQVVARHVDLFSEGQEVIEDPECTLDEAAVVFIADKYINGYEIASMEARFARSIERYGALPAARANIERRRQTARIIRDRIEDALGERLSDLVAAVVSGSDAVRASGETSV